MAEQTPREELAERAAEVVPGLTAAAAAVGLQDHQRMLHHHAQRVKDSHRHMAQTAGFEVAESEDDMGDIIITGDISAADPSSVVDALKGQMGEKKQSPIKSKTNPVNIAMMAALMAMGGAGGAGATFAVTQLMGDKPTPTTPIEDRDFGYSVEKWKPE